MIKNNINSMRGSSLIEVVIAIVIGLGIGVTGLYVLNARVVSVDNVRVTKEAENAGEEALSGLSAVASDLAPGGSFTVINDGVLTISSCSVADCDYVLEPDIDATQRTSPAKGFPWGSAIPNGFRVAFLRRWRVVDVNTNYRLRNVTVALLKDEADTKPSLIVETTVSTPQ